MNLKTLRTMIQGMFVFILSCCISIQASIPDRIARSVESFFSQQSEWVQKSALLLKESQPYLLKWQIDGFQPHEIFDILSSTLLNNATPYVQQASEAHPLAEKAFTLAMMGDAMKEAYSYVKSRDINAFFKQHRQLNQKHKTVEQALKTIGKPHSLASSLALSASFIEHALKDTLNNEKCTFFCLNMSQLTRNATKTKMLMELVSTPPSINVQPFLPIKDIQKFSEPAKRIMLWALRGLQSTIAMYSLAENTQVFKTHFKNHEKRTALKHALRESHEKIWNHIILAFEINQHIQSLTAPTP